MTITRLVLPLGFVVAAAAPTVSLGQVSGAQAPAERPRRELATVGSPADTSRRVIVTAATAPAYSCAAVTCRIVSELDKGVILSVLKTEGEWHQVLVRTSSH